MDGTALTQPESARLRRIRALSTELDAQRQFATDRGKTQEAKASFILVVVGLVVGISSAQLVGTSFWAIGLLPVALALASAVMAVFVLWPRTIDVVDVGPLVEKWVDSDEGQEALEDYLLESKKREIVARDSKYKAATPHLQCAFRLLLVSVAVLLAAAVLNGLLSHPIALLPTQPTPGETP